MEPGSICHDGCNMWLRQKCISMSLTHSSNFTMNEHYDFFCLHCISDVNVRFNFMASLARIASDAPDLDCMRKQADSERNLLKFCITFACIAEICVYEAVNAARQNSNDDDAQPAASGTRIDRNDAVDMPDVNFQECVAEKTKTPVTGQNSSYRPRGKRWQC